LSIKLHSEMTKALQVPDVQARLKDAWHRAHAMSVAEFDTFFRDEVNSTMAIAKAAGIKLE